MIYLFTVILIIASGCGFCNLLERDEFAHLNDDEFIRLFTSNQNIIDEL